MPRNFVPAIELRDQLDEIIARNSNAKILIDVGEDDYAVLDGFSAELDNDGDARFTLRSYAGGEKVTVKGLNYEH
jgi:hypothetical protein